jgi:DNA-binding response OmpR family regulator
MGTGMILVLENDVNTLDTIIMMLKQAGFSNRVTTADRVILDVLTLNPDLLILDLRLESFTTGAVICQTIRSHAHSALLPIILISASDQLKAHALICNADAYISKPFDINEFCNTVKNVLAI